MLAACVESGDIEDAAVRQALSAVALVAGVDPEVVYETLLAWYILEESFSDEEDQWQLIVSKAKSWLESAGVPKPATIVNKFSLILKD